MFLSLLCTTGVLCAEPIRDKLLDVAVTKWVGLTSDQVNAQLGEKPVGFTVAGGTGNLHLSSYYAKSRLTVVYKGDIVVKVQRNK